MLENVSLSELFEGWIEVTYFIRNTYVSIMSVFISHPVNDGFSSASKMKEEIISIHCLSHGYNNRLIASFLRVNRGSSTLGQWLMSSRTLLWCEAECFQYQPVIKAAEQKWDFHPLTVVSKPPAGIQRTILYVSREFTEQSHYISQRDKRKSYF